MSMHPVDVAYAAQPTSLGGQSSPSADDMSHAYGENIHILADPFSLTLLGDLCKQETVQPKVNDLVRELYRPLIRRVINDVFPQMETQVHTRMIEHAPQGVWTGQVVDPQTPAVTVNIMRAGALPSQLCFDCLNRILSPEVVRQDHVAMARLTDENEQVTGAHFGDSKIGGDVNGAVVLFPDPMAATGGSIATAIDYYKNHVEGTPLQFVAMHLIVTPEYLSKIQKDHPDVTVYALRLDRGMSPPDVLQEKPGLLWERESGLNEKQYIVPGGGGFGEIINNSYC